MNRLSSFRLPVTPIGFLLFLLTSFPVCARVVATVDGTPIFQRQVEVAMRRQIDPARLAQLPPDQRQAALERAEKAVLNELVGRILLVNAAQREGLKISEEELQTRMDAISKRLTGGKPVDDFLAENGLEKEEFLRDVRESLLIERLISTKTGDLPPPTAEDVERYYKEHPAEFQQAENVRIRIISVSTQGLTNPLQIDSKRQRIEETRKRLLDNPVLDFAKAVQEESESASAFQGGIVGPFGRGQHAVEPEVEEAAFTQKTGAIGPVIESRSGFHIVRVEEKNPPRLLGLEEVKKDVQTYLIQMKRHETMLRLVEQWRAVAKIERVKQPQPGEASPGQAPQSAPAPAAPQSNSKPAAP